jgi:hypothetical protein
MNRANPENYLFGYSYTGGMPPASLEVLVIGKDGSAQYVAGHPWPKQPPFDEIGIYQRPLRKSELAGLLEVAAAVRRNVAPGRPDMLPADSGMETFFAPQADGIWRASWDPLEPPAGLVEPIQRMRALIADLRAHPLSALRAGLVRPDSASGLSEVQLKLSNRGARRFAFSGFGAATDRPAELRLQFCDPEELALSNSRSPIQLFRSDPLEGVPSTAEELVLGPGEETLLALKDEDGFLQRHDGRAGKLYGLLRVLWKVEGFEDYVEEGWLMTAPLEVG